MRVFFYTVGKSMKAGRQASWLDQNLNDMRYHIKLDNSIFTGSLGCLFKKTLYMSILHGALLRLVKYTACSTVYVWSIYAASAKWHFIRSLTDTFWLEVWISDNANWCNSYIFIWYYHNLETNDSMEAEIVRYTCTMTSLKMKDHILETCNA